MKKVNVEDAIGMELCHDLTAMRDGFKGVAFKRGHIITAEDIPEMLDIGKRTVFVWEPEAGEIHEDEAALRMAAMAKTDHTRYTGPSEGKMLMFADEPGMFRVNIPLLHRINSIGDITISTIPDHYPVMSGDRMASMRIVPLVTKSAQIIEAERLCAESAEPLFTLLPYKDRRAGVIITGSEVYSGRIKDKFEAVVRRKLAAYPGGIVGVTMCDDDLSMILDAANKHLSNGADFLIFTGGMSVDPDDLTPTAIKALGADIVTYGVPAQPGNMTLIAYLGDIPAIGVPGASISLPNTIFDVILPQIYAGVKFTKEETLKLEDGGLCQMCKVCHFPNCTFGRY